MKIKTLVEIEFEVGTLSSYPSHRTKQTIRDSIKNQVINDGNAYYVDDEARRWAVAKMTAVTIKEYGI